MIAAWLFFVGPFATILLLWGLWHWIRLFWIIMWQEYYAEMARRAQYERNANRPRGSI